MKPDLLGVPPTEIGEESIAIGMVADREQTCPCCGNTKPCACAVDPRSGAIRDIGSRFTLIPVLPEEGGGAALQPAELGVPLVREAKFEIVAPDLDTKDALALEKQAEHLDSLIQEERIAEADELAGECLSRVLRFPEHRPVILRKWWILPLTITSMVGVTMLVLYLVV